MFCMVINYIRAKENVCTIYMKCRFTSLSIPSTTAGEMIDSDKSNALDIGMIIDMTLGICCRDSDGSPGRLCVRARWLGRGEVDQQRGAIHARSQPVAAHRQSADRSQSMSGRGK